MEAAISVNDVTAVCHLARDFQVYSAVGVDDGISGGEAGYLCYTDLGKAVCRVCEFHESI